MQYDVLMMGCCCYTDTAMVIGEREVFGPDRNVSIRFDQSTLGFVLRSQGRPRTIGAEGWS